MAERNDIREIDMETLLGYNNSNRTGIFGAVLVFWMLICWSIMSGFYSGYGIGKYNYSQYDGDFNTFIACGVISMVLFALSISTCLYAVGKKKLDL